MNSLFSSPALTLAADSNKHINYRRDADNYLTQVFGAQLPAIETGFFNAHMTKECIVQPHWHTNAEELVFVISGEILTSVFNPCTQQLMSYKLTPGQVSVFPKGWFHWIIVLSEQAHFLAIFDVPTPDVVYGSDFLKAIPPEVLNRAYCVDEQKYKQAVAPLQESVILGPPPGCVCGNNPPSVQGIQKHPYHSGHQAAASHPCPPHGQVYLHGYAGQLHNRYPYSN
ncbi:cupin domain-containing protein [Paenibacillus rhizophilus]|uniref:Cupin domain-containing protein n=1 Tax=Paenibacillus rhizophilus TaxID=1850366 RepID=A0A3N9NZV8_9BACL|nr:cupin domain-containing protein [Paenibacillus rhizophilus]RQW09165.1 cupin domain-containing protein [Paenibacillus rhizophilus]